MPFPVYATGGGTPNQTIAPNLPQFARGIGVVFEVDFFDDAPTNSIPAVPSNPALYPAWTIVDPSGIQITSGVGTPGSNPGRWNASWNVPPSAPLSTQTNKWRIVWNMVTQTARQLQQTNPFDVIELRTPDTLQDLRSQAYLVYANQSERVLIRLPRRPDTLTVQIFGSKSLNDPSPCATPSFTGSLAASSVVEVQEQNLFTYYYDTPPLSSLGDYQVVWTYRQTVTSPTDTTVQQMHVPPPVFWSLAPSLRVLIDKLQKKQGSIQAYVDSDLYEYFQRGLGILNGSTPFTNWTLVNFPYQAATTRFLIEGAALWAMHAQHLLSGELQFSFSGQTATLDLDQTGVYDAVAQKLLEDLTGSGPGSWPHTKVDFIRQNTHIAVVGNRIMGRYAYNQFVYKVNSGTIGSDSPTLGQQFPGPGPIGVGFTLTDVLIYLNLV